MLAGLIQSDVSLDCIEPKFKTEYVAALDLSETIEGTDRIPAITAEMFFLTIFQPSFLHVVHDAKIVQEYVTTTA